MTHSAFTVLAGLTLLAACQEPTEPGADLSAARRAVRSVVITDLGVGAHSEAYAVSSNGLIVGSSAEVVNGNGRPVIWKHGVMRYLTNSDGTGEAHGVNPSGAAVGSGAVPNLAFGATLWKDGKAIDLGVLPNGDFSNATAINAAGQIVGSSDTSHAPGGGDDTEHAVLWQDGVMTDLGTLGGSGSRARAINAAGVVVGASYMPDNRTHAFLWRDGLMKDLGTLPGCDNSEARGINARGQVVGAGLGVYGSICSHAVLWQGGKVIDLGTLPGGRASQANAISPAGDIVGWSGEGETTAGTHAFLWRRGVMTDLGTLPGGDVSNATGINAAGEIVGFSTAARSGPEGLVFHAVKWTVK
jgi:probable HAF family extracellular repeat protein